MAKTGYCSLCQHAEVKRLNAVIEKGASYPAALTAMERFGIIFSKGTFYTHKQHITSPLSTYVDEAPKLIGVPKNNRAVLEAIRDFGMAQAMADPTKVTVKDALRAASILAEKDTKQADITVILAKVVQARPEIDGEFVELPQLEDTEAITRDYGRLTDSLV
jgi:hypothetical protein